MAREESKKIYLSKDGNIYRFVSCRIEPNDGSFYVSLLREGKNYESYSFDSQSLELQAVEHEKPRDKLKRISYHSSGCVIYHNTEHSSNYFEPISRVSKPNAFVIWSIPAIERLDRYSEAVSEEDLVIPISGEDGRIEFKFILAPWNLSVEQPHIAVRYNELFSLLIAISEPSVSLPETVRDCFTTIVPAHGLYDNQVLDNKSALIEYHQKLNNTKDMILYSPNKEGVYKIICAVIMRCAPELDVNFFDESLSSDVLSGKEHVVKFKVRNAHGHYIKNEVPIRSIALDSEL